MDDFINKVSVKLVLRKLFALASIKGRTMGGGAFPIFLCCYRGVWPPDLVFEWKV